MFVHYIPLVGGAETPPTISFCFYQQL